MESTGINARDNLISSGYSALPSHGVADQRHLPTDRKSDFGIRVAYVLRMPVDPRVKVTPSKWASRGDETAVLGIVGDVGFPAPLQAEYLRQFHSNLEYRANYWYVRR